MTFFSVLQDSLSKLLIVVGLLNAYPAVNMSRQVLFFTENDGSVIAEFLFENQLNEAVFSLIDQGVDITFEYRIRTKIKRITVFTGNYKVEIDKSRKGYYANEFFFETQEDLSRHLSLQRFTVLRSEQLKTHPEYEVSIRINMSSDQVPEIMDLWGNTPEMKIKFREKDILR